MYRNQTLATLCEQWEMDGLHEHPDTVSDILDRLRDAGWVIAEPSEALLKDTQHTPGPWNIYTSNRPDGEYEIHTGTFDESEHIASVSGGLGRIDNNGDPFCFESAANARLIAAAPDMLEALQAAEDGVGDWRGMISYAITKATGKEQD